MIVAWRIHYVTLLGRACPQIPCGVVFESWEWKPVVVVLHGKGAEKTEPTLGQMIEDIGQLGGHLNRQSDGSPGPQTVWRGMQRMYDFSALWQAWK
jgi:transposase Tn5 family protein